MLCSFPSTGLLLPWLGLFLGTLFFLLLYLDKSFTLEYKPFVYRQFYGYFKMATVGRERIPGVRPVESDVSATMVLEF